MLRALPTLFARPAALVTSVALHVGAVVAGGHALSEGAQGATGAVAPAEVEVQLDDAPSPPVPPSPEKERASAVAARTPGAGHRHAYPVPPDHDAHPHDPSLVHLAGPRPEPAPAPTKPKAAPDMTAPFAETTASPTEPPQASPGAPSEIPLRFVLGAAGRATSDSTTAGHGEPHAATAGAGVTGTGTLDSPALPESAVDEHARLLSTVPVVYPEAARAAGMEADVPLEVVVDGHGRVTSARPLAVQGLGLADAALHAVRGYRFTPARRAGRAVAVRMRWIVTFRLQ